MYALDTYLVMPGHYKKTANQSSRTIVAGHRIKLDNQEEGLLQARWTFSRKK